MTKVLEPLTVSRLVRAAPERVFDAWTSAEALKKWWGPRGVECTHAEVDLRVGGAYRLANKQPDGSVVWIVGEYEAIERPHRLVYSWVCEGLTQTPERVSVSFVSTNNDKATRVEISHERITDPAVREGHKMGWDGCLEGLEGLLAD